MAHLGNTKYLTLSEASHYFPGRPHRNTIIRWCNRGYAGVKLASWRCGNRRVVTAESIENFIQATTKAKDPNPRRTSSSHQWAEAKLDSIMGTV
jgi:uncharacterized protein DUF1580